MYATTIETTQEFAVGMEDRVFCDRNGNWYWQARGCLNCFGPFVSREAAQEDYERA